jgi:hypothetical protein
MIPNVFKLCFRVLIGCAAVSCLGGGAVLGASETPAIVIAETNYNFGDIPETAPFSHAFVVKNAGKGTLNIKDVKPG